MTENPALKYGCERRATSPFAFQGMQASGEEYVSFRDKVPEKLWQFPPLFQTFQSPYAKPH
jgi:hypothetical protein